MANITIFGTGNMGTAIGTIFSAGGHSVQHINQSTENPTIEGDIVVLAVPFAALAPIAESFKAQLVGKTVVDITNPLNFETFDSLLVPAGSSAAAGLAEALPESHVVKAFNTNFAATLASGKVGETQTTVLVAGDNADAKSALIAAITVGGQVDAVDAGSLARAHELESIGFLQLTLAAGETISWTAGFTLNR